MATQPPPRRSAPRSTHQAQRPPMRAASVQKQAAASAAKKRRRTLISLVILLVGALLLGLFAFFVVKALAPPQAAPSSSVSVSSAPPASSSAPVSQPPAPVLPAATGPHDVEGLPPLYNRFNPIPDEARAALTLADAGGGQQMETQAAEAFLAMQAAARADGITLAPVSGFRTLERQTSNYNNSIQNYLNQGYSQEEATRLTEQYYAIPGTSEHEMGLAMDIGQVNDSFANTPAYTWLQEHCTEYGFIYRYPKEYVETTHINWEPWHYRFIGANHAAEYTALGMNTLEDYVAHFQSSPSGEETSSGNSLQIKSS